MDRCMTVTQVEAVAFSGNVKPWRGVVRWVDESGQGRLTYTGFCSSYGSALRAAQRMAGRLTAK